MGGDVVGVWSYGDPAGRPVFVFHGVPACGAGFEWAGEPARVRGLRLLAPDRPGIGISSPRAGFRVSDYPAMIEALADTLGIDRFSVWGYSGGGPYAAACAAGSTGRLAAAAVCAGMGEISFGWASVGDFEKTDAQMLRLATSRPWLARLMMSVAAKGAAVSPRSAVRSFAKQMSESDHAVLADLGPPKEAMRLFTAAFVHGSGGVVADYAAVARPWDVDLGGTSVPVSIWHGDADTMVPLAHSRTLAGRVPGAELTIWPGEGHLATIAHVGEVLDWLAEHP